MTKSSRSCSKRENGELCMNISANNFKLARQLRRRKSVYLNVRIEI